MRIYFVFLRYMGVSLSTAAIDNGLFIVSLHFWPSVLLCQAVSRFIAGTFQFIAGRQSVFHSQARIPAALLKCWMLVAFRRAQLSADPRLPPLHAVECGAGKVNRGNGSVLL